MLSCIVVYAQTPPAGATPGSPVTQQAAAQTSPIAQLRSNYVLQSGDQILIRAADVDEINEHPFLINEDGFIDLPLVGRTKAGGVSVENLEAVLVEALKKFVKVPQVHITVVQFSNEPVFFVGAFQRPGIYTLTGQRTLVEMVASVGGLAAGASTRIKVTRRKEYGAIPLPNAITLPEGGTSVDINMSTLQNNVNPAEDILLEPFDVISVDIAEMIYVVGTAIAKAGAFPLGQRDSMSVLQVLTLAGGFMPTMRLKDAMILRPISNTSRRAVIPVDLNLILQGKSNDKPLLPNDILIVEAKGGIYNPQNAQTLFPLLSLTALAISLLTRF